MAELSDLVRGYLSEIGSKGGRARAARHDHAQLSAWARLGGRPRRLDARGLERLAVMRRQGAALAECAARLGVSLATVVRHSKWRKE